MMARTLADSLKELVAAHEASRQAGTRRAHEKVKKLAEQKREHPT